MTDEVQMRYQQWDGNGSGDAGTAAVRAQGSPPTNLPYNISEGTVPYHVSFDALSTSGETRSILCAPNVFNIHHRSAHRIRSGFTPAPRTDSIEYYLAEMDFRLRSSSTFTKCHLRLVRPGGRLPVM